MKYWIEYKEGLEQTKNKQTVDRWRLEKGVGQKEYFGRMQNKIRWDKMLETQKRWIANDGRNKTDEESRVDDEEFLARWCWRKLKKQRRKRQAKNIELTKLVGILQKDSSQKIRSSASERTMVTAEQQSAFPNPESKVVDSNRRFTNHKSQLLQVFKLLRLFLARRIPR